MTIIADVGESAVTDQSKKVEDEEKTYRSNASSGRPTPFNESILPEKKSFAFQKQREEFFTGWCDTHGLAGEFYVEITCVDVRIEFGSERWIDLNGEQRDYFSLTPSENKPSSLRRIEREYD